MTTIDNINCLIWSRGTNTIMNMDIPSARGRGRPRKSWSDCIKTDLSVCGMGNTSPHNRDGWRAGVSLLPTSVSGTPAADDKLTQDMYVCMYVGKRIELQCLCIHTGLTEL